MNTTVYYSPEAVGSLAGYFFDGEYMYERVHGLGSLGALDGWLKRIGRKIRRGVKKGLKAVGKVAKKGLKLIKKAIPIVSTALTFIPGAGWVAKAGLSLAEAGISAYDKHRAKRRKRKANKLKRLKAVKAAQQRLRDAVAQKVKSPSVRVTPVRVAPPPKVYTVQDFIRINNAVKAISLQLIK
jgi:hypothetical protein